MNFRSTLQAGQHRTTFAEISLLSTRTTRKVVLEIIYKQSVLLMVNKQSVSVYRSCYRRAFLYMTLELFGS